MLHKLPVRSETSRPTLSTEGKKSLHLAFPGASAVSSPAKPTGPLPDLLVITARRCSAFFAEAAVLVLVRDSGLLHAQGPNRVALDHRCTRDLGWPVDRQHRDGSQCTALDQGSSLAPAQTIRVSQKVRIEPVELTPPVTHHQLWKSAWRSSYNPDRPYDAEPVHCCAMIAEDAFCFYKREGHGLAVPFVRTSCKVCPYRERCLRREELCFQSATAKNQQTETQKSSPEQ